MGYYDTAQVCLNGHVITDRYRSYSEFQKSFCDKCGQATIVQCPSCKRDIQGEYVVEGVIGFGGEPKAPSYCHSCGKPYPWTAAKINAAQAMADEIDELSDADKILLKTSIAQIAVDSPMSEVAVVRIKKILPKIAKGLGDVLRKLIIDVASETIKKSSGF